MRHDAAVEETEGDKEGDAERMYAQRPLTSSVYLWLH